MLREWSTVIIVLLIITVVLDGLRRMRQSRREALRMSLSMHKGTCKEDLDEYGSELPSGGARVASIREEEDARLFYEQLRQAKQDKISRTGRPYRIPEQVSLNLDEQVPMLMESVDEREDEKEIDQFGVGKARTVTRTASADHSKTRTPPKQSTAAASSAQSKTQPKREQPIREQAKREQPKQDPLFDELGFGDDARVEPSFSESEFVDDEQDVNANVKLDAVDDFEEEIAGDEYSGSTDEGAWSEAAESTDDETLFEKDVKEEQAYQEEVTEEFAEDTWEEEPAEEPVYIEPEEVLVINVMAPQDAPFNGPQLLNTVIDQGMRYGSMDIFHHHAKPNGEGTILYSMANIVKPGTFDLNQMAEFTTPGVSLFMTLPLDADPKAAFAAMLTTAQALSEQLGGELKDERRSVMTMQTAEHYRTRIEEFKRKQLSRAPA